jgi:hypothetical protein
MKETITLDRKDAEEIAAMIDADLESDSFLESYTQTAVGLLVMLRDKLAGRIE